MSDTTYIDYVQPAVSAEWLNEINDHVWHDTPVVGAVVHSAATIANTPAGTIVATNVQAAINELDTEKLTDSFLQSGTGAITRTITSKLKDIVSVKDFGCVELESDSTTKYQAAITYAIANNITLDISGNYNITSISLNGANGLRLTGRGSVVGIASGATDAVVFMKNVGNVAIDGAWFINGNYNTNYEQGLWAYTDAGGQQAAYLDFANLSIVNCKLAYKFGNDARPDDLVSEINVRGGNTYGCPSVVLAVGAQTVVNFSNTTLASLTGSGNAGWQALPQRTIVARGATVNITGGEVLHVLVSTGGASTAFNVTCQVETIASVASGNIYGNISVCNAVVESAVRLVSSANPSSLVLPTAGLVKFSACVGVSTQDTSAFVETDTDFLGTLVFKGNRFFATSARSNQTISCGGLCHIYCDDESFGSNFIPWVQGTSGGVIHFPFQMVLDANNLNAQALTSATPVTLKPITAVSTGSLARFSGNYSAATGEFTVPAGGLKNIRIDAQLLKAGLAGEWYVQINGISYGVRTLGQYNHNSYSISALAAGDKVKVACLNTAATVNAASATTDWLQIFASN